MGRDPQKELNRFWILSLPTSEQRLCFHKQIRACLVIDKILLRLIRERDEENNARISYTGKLIFQSKILHLTLTISYKKGFSWVQMFKFSFKTS